MLDFARGVRTRLTFHQAIGSNGIWSPDGSRILFATNSQLLADTLVEKAASGAGEEKVLFKSPAPKNPVSSWSRDGRFVSYTAAGGVWILPIDGEGAGKPVNPAPAAPAFLGSFSPDGRWFAYVSIESGAPQVYVIPFAPAGGPPAGKWQVSKDGSTTGNGSIGTSGIPKWRSDGKEIIFAAPNGSPMAVDVTSTPTFQPGVPKQLFSLPAGAGDWDVTQDHKRFLVAMPLQQQAANTPLTVR